MSCWGSRGTSAAEPPPGCPVIGPITHAAGREAKTSDTDLRRSAVGVGTPFEATMTSCGPPPCTRIPTRPRGVDGVRFIEMARQIDEFFVVVARFPQH